VTAFDVYVDMEIRVRYRVYADNPEAAEDLAEAMAEQDEEGQVVEREILPAWAEPIDPEFEDDEV
jgi:hypothetical protein